MINKLGGRKFVMSTILLVLNFVLFYGGMIDAKDWQTVSTAILGVYVLGNVVNSVTK